MPEPTLADRIKALRGALIEQVQVDEWDGEITRVILHLHDGRTLYFSRSNDPVGYHWTIQKWSRDNESL